MGVANERLVGIAVRRVNLRWSRSRIFLILAMSRRSYLVLHTSSSPDGPHSSGFSTKESLRNLIGRI